jgi:hypothetical protein
MVCLFSLSALLEFNQSVLVNRKNPESRKRAVIQIKERLNSNGYWPQVSRDQRAGVKGQIRLMGELV